MRHWGRLLIAMAAPGLAWVSACGSDRPNAAGDGTNLIPGYGTACGTPNDGCPCIEPGKVVPCGKVVHQSADYVTCSMGHRQCIGALWGACIGDTDVTTKTSSFSILGSGIGEGGGVHTLGLGSPSSCTTGGGGLAGGTTLCVGGSKGGEKCKTVIPCPGGACTLGKCSGGANDDKGCNVAADCPGGSCNPGDGKCVGGPQDLSDCKQTPCPGGTCTAFVGTCANGSSDGNGCNVPADCPGGTCVPGEGFCIGGSKDGNDCKTSAQCPGGTCYVPGVDAGVSIANPCDPYCHQIVDTPTGLVLGGGLASIDGGITIVPGGDAGVEAGASGTPYQTTATGDSACAPGLNVHNATCTIPTQLTDCQQDFRCDPASLTCVWNGGPGYFDPSAPGVDLTVGAACTVGGFPGPANVPICNRGSATVPAGTSIGINVSNPPAVPAGCTAIGPPDCADVAPAGGLAPGQCMNISGCPSLVPGNKYLTVNAGQRDIPEPGGRCANNAGWGKTAGGCAVCGTCNTQVTGKVYDPSGAPPTAGANNVFLAGVTVFEPSGALTVLPDVAACDTCTGLDSPSIAKAVTAADGTFTLSGVTPGPNVPIVVQSGRWRRRITMPVVACATTAVVPGTLRMPQNRTDGLGGVADIPRTALVMSDNESLECLLVKMGISTSEFGAYSVAAPQRIRLFSNNGLTYAGAPAAVPNVFGALNEHAQTIFDCDGAEVFSPSPLWSSTTAAQKSALQTYTSVGGKVFMDHLPGQTFLMTGPAPFSGVSTWNGAIYQNTGLSFPAKGKVLNGTPPQTQFLSWLANVSAMTDYGSPYIRSDVPRRHSLNPAAGTTTWIRGETANDWAGDPTGNYALSFSFEMGKVGAAPTVNADCGAATGHGRVIFNGMHVSQSRSSYPASGSFPGACNLAPALSPEEKALEYQLFQLTACQLGGAPPPPPPAPPPPLAAVVFTRDFGGTCAAGEQVKWGPFYWESVIPPGTSITFNAATAATIAALPPAPAAAPPVTANVGTASTTVTPPAFDCTGCPGAPVTVDSQLIADTATKSKAFLRVYMKFNPTATVSPTLVSWRQVYDCVPAE